MLLLYFDGEVRGLMVWWFDTQFADFSVIRFFLTRRVIFDLIKRSSPASSSYMAREFMKKFVCINTQIWRGAWASRSKRVPS